MLASCVRVEYLLLSYTAFTYSHFERSQIMDCKFRDKEMAYNVQLVIDYKRYKWNRTENVTIRWYTDLLTHGDGGCWLWMRVWMYIYMTSSFEFGSRHAQMASIWQCFLWIERSGIKKCFIFLYIYIYIYIYLAVRFTRMWKLGNVSWQ